MKIINQAWLTSEVKNKSLHLIAEESNIPYSAIYAAVKKYKLKLPDGRKVQKRQSPNKSENIKKALKKNILMDLLES